MPANRRVVVTGMGVVSSIGIGKDEFWRNLLAGRSGINDIERFDTSGFPIHRAGEIKNFDTKKFFPDELGRYMGRASQFVIASAKLALADGGLGLENIKPDEIGVVIGTTMGEIPSLEMMDKHWLSNGEDDVYGSSVEKYPANKMSENAGYYFKFTGDNWVIPTACASGNYSIGYAFDLIRTGRKPLMLAGGADPLSRLAFTGFNRLFAMAPDICRPFDKNRKGMMLGEGGAVLLIEALEHAKDRGAPIYAEILGYGLSCDAFNMTIPSEKGIAKVMEKAIKNGGIDKSEVDYISAHGTGTGLNDKTESMAVNRVFGSAAADIPISSIKSMLGHTMGAASAIEAITCCLAICDSMLPPTINYETPDAECDLDYVPNKARKKNIDVALNNSFAFGGNNACVAFGKYPG